MEEKTVEKELTDDDLMRQTAALWKYRAVPSKDVAPEPAPEHAHENHTIGDWQVIAARVRGKKHKHDGSNCDDWFETENVGGIFIAAVSDGAGSKKFSRIGSREACKTAVFSLKTNLGKLLSIRAQLIEDLGRSMTDSRFGDAATALTSAVQRAMQDARQAIVDAYEARRNSPHYTQVVGRKLALTDFAATLLLTMVVPLPNIGQMLTVGCQVGDGIIAALDTTECYDKAVTLLGVPDSGAFAGETDFLTSSEMVFTENLMRRTKLARKPFDLVVAMTDGVADDYDPNERELRRLYFDLVANRVLPIPTAAKFGDIGAVKIPDPPAFPKIDGSASKTEVPVQYTAGLCQLNKLTLAEVWQNPALLSAMANKLPEAVGQNPSMRLQEWLDNYTLRGSFDDRTLVVLRKGGGDGVR